MQETNNLPQTLPLSRTADISRSSFFDEVNSKPSQESIDKYERAFQARLAYEKNCIAKYDFPDGMMMPSLPPKEGERMYDYAMRFGTTIEEMKECLPAVERALQNGL
jgi:hypothetical protein